jgi:hypothetical protein
MAGIGAPGAMELPAGRGVPLPCPETSGRIDCGNVAGSSGVLLPEWLVVTGGVLGLLLLAATIVLAIAVAALRRRAAERPEPAIVASGGTRSSFPVGAAPAPPPPAPAAQPSPATDTRALVLELIALADLATGPALEIQAARVLRTLSVEKVATSVGDRFDPDIHAAVGSDATTDPAAQHTVAEIVRPGWRTGGRIIRPTEVRVWVLVGATP